MISQEASTEDTFFYFPASPERDALLAVGVESLFKTDSAKTPDWNLLDEWLSRHNDWRFGWISYDARKAIERLPARHASNLFFPELLFFVPMHLFQWTKEGMKVLKGCWDESFLKYIQSPDGAANETIHLEACIDRASYVESVEAILGHIHRGDIYEVNYCQSFRSAKRLANPAALWQRVNSFTSAPFSVYARHGSLYAFCGSPERFLKREGNRVISQPIKGTIRRGVDADEDRLRQEELLNSQKERSENVMIVDLVRNDLSRSAKKGSVRVEELFGIHSFKTVHHMISTISAEPKPGTGFSQLIRDCFPMGSMTGAPKIRAMEIIDAYETQSRELYSGTIGYIRPDGDFDFNVVIRTILYNEDLPLLSLTVGGAITALCDAEKEYEECLLKASALLKALEGKE